MDPAGGAAAPGRSFTPHGHLLGSIGEVLAAARYGLDLTIASTQEVYAIAPDGRSSEIKCTTGRVIALRVCAPQLLVLRLEKNGTDVTIYNGHGERVWAAAGKPSKRNGQRKISLSKLAELQAKVPAPDQLPEI